MRVFHWVEIENFKVFGSKQRIELDHPAVIIGPNNCGKTSVIQALALWSQAIKTWHDARLGSNAKDRTGTALNRLNIVNVPVSRTRFFWHDTRVRTGNQDIPLVITIGVEHRGDVIPVAVTFRNRGEDLVYCTLDKALWDNTDLIGDCARTNVELLYPMSGLEIEEPVLQPGRIGVLLGQGQTAQVLRNLCLMVYRDSPRDWQTIAGLMERLFHVELGVPQENARGAIDLTYRQRGSREPLALSSAGRGFQQMLLIFSYLYSHKRSVLLVDEPDAHLEILRQKQVYVLLRDIASANQSQVVIVTHSASIVEEALDKNLTLILNGRADNIAKKTAIHESLKIFGAMHYVRARQRGYVLYVEGSTDLDILNAFATKLQHPASKLWDANPNVFYVENVHPEPTTEEALEKVEGGFGLTPKEHFDRVRKLLPDLQGLAILDNDGRARKDSSDGGLQVRYWRRYEAENYVVTPQLLERYLQSVSAELGLFAIPREQSEQTMADLMKERVFAGDERDYQTWREASPASQRLIWEAKTQFIKLSTFAEEFFRRLHRTTRVGILLKKGELHRLVDFMDSTEISGDVVAALDDVERLFSRARSL